MSCGAKEWLRVEDRDGLAHAGLAEAALSYTCSTRLYPSAGTLQHLPQKREYDVI